MKLEFYPEKKLKKEIKKIAQKYNLELILLFGSRLDKKIHQESDFDVAYSGRRNLNLNQEAKLIIDLSPIFKSENIDLVNLKKASPLLLYAITKDCKVIFEEDSLIYDNLRAYAFKKYIETKPLYEEKFKRLRKKIEAMV